MFMVWDSSHEDLQLFDWVSNTASYGFISFYVNPPSYSYDKSFFEIWPSKSKVKVIAQGHVIGITPYRLISLLFHVDRACHSWDTAISKFDLENSRSRSWVRSKLKVIIWLQHSVNSHPFRSMSIGHPIPELWLFPNLTLKIKGQGHGWGHSSKS